MTQKRLSKRTIILSIAAGVGLLLLAYGAFGIWQQYQATHQTSVVIPTDPVAYSTDEPDETMPTEACRDYSVADALPRKITIDAIGVDACIQRVGLDQHNAIAVPTNIHLAGWFVDSPLPGEAGNSIIDGHVLGRFGDAVFVDLSSLQVNDIVSIQFGDYSEKKFRVIETQTYTVEQADTELFKQVEGIDRQLSLITCGGVFDTDAQTYDRRVIVRTEALNG